jgi:hypothetical protein
MEQLFKSLFRGNTIRILDTHSQRKTLVAKFFLSIRRPEEVDSMLKAILTGLSWVKHAGCASITCQ